MTELDIVDMVEHLHEPGCTVKSVDCWFEVRVHLYYSKLFVPKLYILYIVVTQW